jgi:hypothetical protein
VSGSGGGSGGGGGETYVVGFVVEVVFAVVFIGVTCFVLVRRRRGDRRKAPPSDADTVSAFANPMHIGGDLAPYDVYDNSSSPAVQATLGRQPSQAVYATTVPAAAPQRAGPGEGFYEEPDASDYAEPVPVNSHHTVTNDSRPGQTRRGHEQKTRGAVKLDQDLYVSES